MKFSKFLRTPFFTEHLSWLHLQLTLSLIMKLLIKYLLRYCMVLFLIVFQKIKNVHLWNIHIIYKQLDWGRGMEQVAGKD